MGRISRHVCDKCGHDQVSDGSPAHKNQGSKFKDDREMIWVGVAIQRNYQYGPNAQFLNEEAKQLWCLPCCEANNIIAKKDEPKPTPPTLDEMLEELVETKVSAAMDNH